eukprot:225052-Chlamydomonas_euryale.AAC.1
MLTPSRPLVCSSFHFARNRFGCSFWFFLASGWPPAWSLLRGAASSVKPSAALLRLWRSAFLFNHVQVHETFVYNWMDGWMDGRGGRVPPVVRGGSMGVCGGGMPWSP